MWYVDDSKEELQEDRLRFWLGFSQFPNASEIDARTGSHNDVGEAQAWMMGMSEGYQG